MAEQDDNILEDEQSDQAAPAEKKEDVDISDAKKRFRLNLNMDRRTLIIVAVTVVLLLALTITAIVLLSSGDNTEQTESSETLPAEVSAEQDTIEGNTAAVSDTAPIDIADNEQTASPENTVVETPTASNQAPMSHGRLNDISGSIRAGSQISNVNNEQNSTDAAPTEVTTAETVITDASAAQPSLPNEIATEITDPEQLKLENEALKKQISKLEAEVLRKDYLIRTSEIIRSRENDQGSAKRQYEKPLDIELAPSWGKNNKPDVISSSPAAQ